MSENKSLTERNQIIRKEIVNGKTFSEMARKFGISYERVRQILKCKANYKRILKERREKRFQERLKKAIEKADELGRVLSYIEIKDITSHLQDIKSIIKILKEKGYPPAKKGGPSRIDDKLLLEYLRELSARLGKTAGGLDILKSGKYSHSTYYAHFGSLRKAQKLAGLKPNRVGEKNVQMTNDYNH